MALGSRRIGDTNRGRLSQKSEDSAFAEDDIFQTGAGLSTGYEQTIGTFQGVRSLFNTLTGDDAEAEEYMLYAQERFQAASESGGTVTSYDQIEGIADAARWATYSIGTVLPSIATSVVGGGVGGFAVSMLGKKLVSKAVQKEVKDKVEAQASKSVRDRMVRDTMARRTQPFRSAGQLAGTMGASIAQNTGATFVDVYEETGIMAPDVALAAGVMSGALDAFAPLRVAKKIMPAKVFTQFKDKMADNIVNSGGVVKRALVEGFKIAGLEGPTEAMQELIQASAVGMMKNDPNASWAEFGDEFFANLSGEDEELNTRLINAFLVGALGGGTIGAATGAVSPQTKAPVKVKKNLEQPPAGPDGTPPPAGPNDTPPPVGPDGSNPDAAPDLDNEETLGLPLLEDEDIDLRLRDARKRQEAARRKARGLPPISESGQVYADPEEDLNEKAADARDRQRQARENQQDLGKTGAIDLETPQEYVLSKADPENTAPEISLNNIDLEQSFLEDPDFPAGTKVRLLETRGRNKDGVLVGTVQIRNKDFADTFEVFFNDPTPARQGLSPKEALERQREQEAGGGFDRDLPAQQREQEQREDAELEAKLAAVRARQKAAREKVGGLSGSAQASPNEDAELSDLDEKVANAQERRKAAIEKLQDDLSGGRRAGVTPEQRLAQIREEEQRAREVANDLKFDMNLRRTAKAQRLLEQLIPASMGETGRASPEENQAANKASQKEAAAESGAPILLGPDHFLKDLVGQTVDYDQGEGIFGIQGVLIKRHNGYFVVTDDQDVIVESGEKSETTTAGELGVRPVEVDVPQKLATYNPEDNSLTLSYPQRGGTFKEVEFTYVSTDFDDEGKAVSVSATTKDGGNRTIKSPQMVAAIESARAESQIADAKGNRATEVDIQSLPPKVGLAVIEGRQESGEDVGSPSVSEAEATAAIGSLAPDEQADLAKRTQALFAESDLVDTPVQTTFTDKDEWREFNGKTVGAGEATLEERQAVLDDLAGQPVLQNNGEDIITMPSKGYEEIAERIAKAMNRPLQMGNPVSGKMEQFDGIASITAMGGDTPVALTEIQHAIFDLIESGMPIELIEQMQSISVHNASFDGLLKGADGAADILGRGISLDIGVVGQSRELSGASALRWILAHEGWHVLDVNNSISVNIPAFDSDVIIGGEGLTLRAGAVVNELYENYLTRTDLGRVFQYPFSMIESEAELSFSGTDNIFETDLESIGQTIRMEVFAQLGAIYLSDPKLLKSQAPQAYEAIRTIRDNPTLNEDFLNGNANQTGQTPAQPESTGVQGQVRTPPVSGSNEVEDNGGSGDDGASSADAEPAQQGLGGEAFEGDGDGDGRLVSEETQGVTPSAEAEITVQNPLFAKKRVKPNATLGIYSAVKQKDGSMVVFGEPEEIRAKIPEGIKGRAVSGGLAFTSNMAPRVEASLTGREITYSRAGEISNHQTKNGKYVGAPEKYNTPAKVNSLRKQLRLLALEGEKGKMWYENSGEVILMMTGGDRAEAEKFVKLLAIYSPQAKVDANSTFALRAWAQYKAGEAISVKTGSQDGQATGVLYENKPWGGEKTNNFYLNLMREIDPSTADKQGATIDMWMMRAGGYDTDAPNGSQYKFMEIETNRLTKELGWEPQQVQAAIWVAMKARMENKGVKQQTEQISEKKGWIRFSYPEKNGQPKKTRVILDQGKHMLNWINQSMKHTPTEQDTGQAKFDFSDGVRRHIGQISKTFSPSINSGVLEGFHGATASQKAEFEFAIEKVFYDTEGNDKLANYLGLLTDSTGFTGSKISDAAVSSARQTMVAMAPAKGDDGKKNIDPEQKSLLDVYSAAIGLLLNQDSVGYHRPFYKASKKDSHGVEFNTGGPLTAAQTEQLSEIIIDIFGESAPSVHAIPTPEGVRIIDFNKIPHKEFDKMTAQVADRMDPELEVERVFFAHDGNTIQTNWETDNGKNYIDTIRGAGRSDLFGWLQGEFAEKIQAVNTDFAERFGWGSAGQVSERFKQEAATSEVATEENIWSVPEQKYDSSSTSINKNKLPQGFTKLKAMGVFQEGQLVVDIGGGKFDNAVNDLAKRGVTLRVYDPFNRSPEHNREVANEVSGGNADVAISNNVLNVIEEDVNITRVIDQAFDAIPVGAKAYFTVYGGNQTGVGAQTTKGWQRNERTKDYVPRLEEVFGEGNITVKGDVLTATKAGLAANPSAPVDQPLFMLRSKDGSERTMGMNVAVADGQDYADLIVSGQKKYETRATDSLKPYVGERIGIVRTNKGKKAELVGYATVGEPIVADERQFNDLRSDHLVPKGSQFDIQQGGQKFLYEMLNPEKLQTPQDASGTRGIVARNITGLADNKPAGKPLLMKSGDDSNVSDLSARREMNNLKKFRGEFFDRLNDRIQLSKAFDKAAEADGLFGSFEKGMRYVTTQENSDGKTVSFKSEILGLTMGRLGPVDRSGKYSPFGATPEDQIIKGPDGKDYVADVYIKTINPEGDEYTTTAAVWKLEKQTADGNLKFMGGLRGVPAQSDKPLYMKRPSGQTQPYEDALETGTLLNGEPTSNEITLDDETRIEASIRKIQDKYLTLKKFQGKAAEFLGINELPPELDAYIGEELMSGKLKSDFDGLESGFVKPIGDILRANDMDVDDAGLYLMAKHARERNRYIASINKSMPDGGSGLTNEQADQVINSAREDGTLEAKEEVAEIVYDMLQKNRDRMAESGLLDEGTVDSWNENYDYYVPLKGFATTQDEDGTYIAPMGISKGFNVSGKEAMAALGRESQSANPLLFALFDVENKLVRARRNEVGQRFLNMAEAVSAAGSQQFTVYRDGDMPAERFQDSASGEVVFRPMAVNTVRGELRQDTGDKRFMGVKVDGKEVFIEIKDAGLNRAMHNVGADSFDNLAGLLDKGVGFLQKFQNFRRNMLINYNPSWMVINPLRDLQTGIMYNLAEESKEGGRVLGENMTADILANYLPTGKAYYQNTRGKSSGNAELDAFYEEYQSAGAATGLTLTRDIDEQKRRLGAMISDGSIKSRIRSLGKLVEDLNASSENVIRFATFVAARRNDVTLEKAASLAKNLTVNFTRKGELSSGVNLMYLFFNAAVQGTANIAQALSGRTTSGGFTKGQVAVASMALISYLVTEHNLMASEEDDDGKSVYDDLSDYDKLMSWNIVKSDGKSFWQIPMPYGYGFFHTLGRLGAEYANESIDFGDVLATTTAAFAHHMLPPPLGFVGAIGKSDDAMDFVSRAAVDLAPDVFEPALALAVNKNHFGSPLYLEGNPLMTPTPDSSKSKRSTEKIYTDLAQALNDVSGGSLYRTGSVDISPDSMKYFVEYLSGGLGRFISRSMDVSQKLDNEVTADDVPLRNYPIFRYFNSDPNGYNDQMEYYENIKDAQQIFLENKEISGREKVLFAKQNAPVIKLETQYKSVQKELRALRKQKKLIEKNQTDPVRAYELITQIEEKMQLLFDQFNKNYRAATK